MFLPQRRKEAKRVISSLRDLCVLCASAVNLSGKHQTADAQRTQEYFQKDRQPSAIIPGLICIRRSFTQLLPV